MKNILFCIILLHCFQQYMLDSSDLQKTVCYQDLLHNTSTCKLSCPFGSFALPGMDYCQTWMNCDAEITLLSLISVSVVKTVYLAKWKGYNIVLSVLSSPNYKEDFLHNLHVIKSFSPNNFVVQLLGYCNYSLLTEYYELGNALNLQYNLQHSLKVFDSTKIRLNFCINYVSIIKFLHNSPLGVLVMCDSNTLEKTLSQYLVTPDLKLVVNDLDATPLVDISTGGVHCGHKELTGAFIAPEQAWPNPEKAFNITEMPFYDEKTDIFKVPDVCNWFLGNNPDADVIKYKLFSIHKSCKNTDPHKRPNADAILRIYENILHNIS